MKLFSPLLIALFLFATRTFAETYRVGAQRELKTLATVASRLQAGDVVEIDPGTYHETVRIKAQGTRENPIVIRGVGEKRPVFDAENLDVSGVGAIPRAIIQIEGAYITLEHLEFRNARNEQNAAGVRLLDSLWATIRDCRVSQCDMGIFGGDRETVLIENCEIFENGTPKFSGGSHNFYMHGNRVVVRGCYIHDSLWGQNYKSRAHYNELWWNVITDSNEGEVGCVDANGHTDTPNSNVVMVGNTLISKSERTGNAAKFVLFGSELPAPDGGSHNGTLFLFHNTFVAGNERVQFITLDDPQAKLVAQGNVFVGSKNILHLARPAADVRAQGNLLPADAMVPNWNAELGVPQYVDGEGATHDLPMARSTVTDDAKTKP